VLVGSGGHVPTTTDPWTDCPQEVERERHLKHLKLKDIYQKVLLNHILYSTHLTHLHAPQVEQIARHEDVGGAGQSIVACLSFGIYVPTE
jgi:hypothetical protein